MKYEVHVYATCTTHIWTESQVKVKGMVFNKLGAKSHFGSYKLPVWEGGTE